jgi:hypothetical protein
VAGNKVGIGTLAVCGLVLAGRAMTAQVPPPRLLPAMTLTASSTVVLTGHAPVLAVTMPARATGEVTFDDAAQPGTGKGIGLAPIVDGVATLTAPDRPLALGDNPVQASYGGNGVYGPAESNEVTLSVVGPRQTVSFTGNGQTVASPLGATLVRITATGGSGATAVPCGRRRSADGGFGAMVTGTVVVASGADLIIDVGGAGSGWTGGWGATAGGGNGGHRSRAAVSGYGAGGGGATTVRLGLPAMSTLMIAGGGGGGGGCTGLTLGAGGNGGSAGPVAGDGKGASGRIAPAVGGPGGGAPEPAGQAGLGSGGGGGGGAPGGLGGTGSAAGGGGGAGATSANSAELGPVSIGTAPTTGNGAVTLQWLTGLPVPVTG